MDDYTNRRERPITLNLTGAAGPTVHWFEVATKVSDELGRFAQHRAQANLDVWEQMAQCGGSPLRLFEIHQDWLKATVRDYVHANRRIMGMTGDLMQEPGPHPEHPVAQRPANK